ncbi:MAG TPA: hypothetical protein VFT22_40615 [Kofleriaceae bacterium]|nr:hypothetical protein [Kofleriaceae bacterium]
MNRDDLERALAADFVPEHLSVYGDYLQSIGDPRGELIAIDLAGLDDEARRDQLITRWLGDVPDLLCVMTVECGFITDLYLDGDDPLSAPRFDELLAGPGAPYLRGVTIRGRTPWARHAVATLVTRPHRWLQRLSIQVLDQDSAMPPSLLAEDPGDLALPTGPPSALVIDDALAAALTATTPRLEELEVWGRRVFGELAHDALRSMCVTGADAVGSLVGDGPVRLPALTVLDLAFHVERDRSTVDHELLDALLPSGRLPRLRRLDLSRNEPGMLAPHNLGGRVDATRFLARQPIRRQLTHVRMPSVRSQRQADHLANAVADMTVLRELVVVRSYRPLPHVVLPPAASVAPPFPWQPVDLCVNQIAAVVWRSPERRHASVPPEFVLPLPPIVAWLEEAIGELPPAARAAWLELLDSLAYYSETALSRGSARAALASLDAHLGSGIIDEWLRLRSALDKPADGDVVQFRLL